MDDRFEVGAYFVNGIMENKEWMLVDGVWTEMQQEQAKTLIKRATQRDIEEVSMHIFKNFIKIFNPFLN